MAPVKVKLTHPASLPVKMNSKSAILSSKEGTWYTAANLLGNPLGPNRNRHAVRALFHVDRDVEELLQDLSMRLAMLGQR